MTPQSTRRSSGSLGRKFPLAHFPIVFHAQIMSKRVKNIAGCLLSGGERLGLRRVEERSGPTLLCSHLELHRGEEVLAAGPTDIEAKLRQMDLSRGDLRWLLGHLSEAVRS
jgi:hypothetical protein